MVINLQAQSGQRNLTLTTPDGTYTFPNVFTVTPAVPVVTGLTPSSGAAGQTVNAVVSGSNLATVTGVAMTGATVTIGTPTFNSLPITLVLPIGIAPGSKTIVVTGPGGTANVSFTVTFPAPTFTSITPTSAVEGTTINATITGTNLLGVSNVSLGQGVTVTIGTGRTATSLPVTITIASPIAYAPCLNSPVYQGFTAGCISPFGYLAMGSGATKPIALAAAKFNTAFQLRPWQE